jgi:hypothetical protein
MPTRIRIVLAVVAVAVLLALAGSYVRRRPAGGCAYDGVAIEPLYRVRVVDDEGQDRVFCCIRCAELWLEGRRAPPRAVFVTDERSGQEVAAAAAWFVRSGVVTTPTSGNRVHTFRDRADAERHAATARGQVLDAAERPF